MLTELHRGVKKEGIHRSIFSSRFDDVKEVRSLAGIFVVFATTTRLNNLNKPQQTALKVRQDYAVF